MVITGSAIFIEPGADLKVIERLKDFPAVTFHVKSDSGTELVVNFEADDHAALEALCAELRREIPEIVEISHIYVNFEDEVAKIRAGETEKDSFPRPPSEEW
jgi:hypothetical protein